MKGKVKKFEDNFSITATSIRRIADASMVDIVIGREPSFADMHRLKDILNLHKGEDPVMLHFRIGSQSKVILVGSQFWVSASPELITDIKANFSEALRVSASRVRA